MRGGGSFTQFHKGGHLLGYGLIALVLAACAMPSLETGSNLLTVPPGGTERAALTATPEPAMAQQSSGQDEAVLLGAASQRPPETGGSTGQSQTILAPLPADGILRGEFWGSSVAFADGDGLVCAGRLIGHQSELNRGLSVPVNCSDGRAGRVKIVSFATPDEAEAVLLVGDTASLPVRLSRSASLE